MTTPEIEELKSLVEQKYGKILATTTDFEEFHSIWRRKQVELFRHPPSNDSMVM